MIGRSRAIEPFPPLLASTEPMLLDERFIDLEAPGWVYEIKFDGYRLMAEFGAGACRLKTKNGGDATTWFPEITNSLSEVPGGPYLIDGEVVVMDDLGRSDFDRLQDRARRRRWVPGCNPVAYCVFDLLVDRGKPLFGSPLLNRKRRLDALLTPLALDNIMVVSHFDEGQGKIFFEQAVLPLQLEGLVAKRIDSGYTPGVRSPAWVKVKRKGSVPPERFKRP